MTIYYQDEQLTLHHGDSLDVLRTMADGSVDCAGGGSPASHYHRTILRVGWSA